MQSLEIISVNIWQILISLINLIILFLILKRFLFAPVKKVLKARQEALDRQYESAERAEKNAAMRQKEWEQKMQTVAAEADRILQTATSKAQDAGDRIVNDAKQKAEGIIRQAENDAELEYNKAQDRIKTEIVDLSAVLTEKMLGREVNRQDHRDLIDSFIEEIGDTDDRDE